LIETITTILIDRIWYSSILDEGSFRGADCDTDHSLVVAKVRDRLAVSTKATHMFDVDKFNMRRLYELQVRK